jgi:hypothetical protein
MLFYVLHHDGTPIANVAMSELAGVGTLEHVWTDPAYRGKGASTYLLRLAMENFAAWDGKALFLETGVDSIAYRMYVNYGFRPIEPRSPYMEYYATSKATFEAAYFAQAPVAIHDVAWRHWPASQALFVGDFPGLVRCAPLKLIGRHVTEDTLVPLLYDEKLRADAGEKPRSKVLSNTKTTAVVGLAAWDWHPLWRDICLLDVYCHPNYWDSAGNLLAALPLPAARRFIAYADEGDIEKPRVLSQFGFTQTAVIQQRIATSSQPSGFLNVHVYER